MSEVAPCSIRRLSICVATVVLVGTPSSTAGVFTDDFNDNSTNTSFWTASVAGTGPTIAETNQRVEIFLPSSAATNPGATYTSKCTLGGDYDVSVDYQLVVWPADNGVRVGLAAAPGGIMERVSFGNNDHLASVPREVYLRHFDPVGGGEQGITATSATSGKLRLIRTGNALTAYYHGSSSGWIALPSGTTSTAPATLSISVWTEDVFFDDQNVTVAFDNYVVNAGTLSCPFPVCTAQPKTEISVLGINGTVTAGGGGFGIATVALMGGASNVSLSVTPFTPGASPVTFRAVQTNASLNAQGTVLATDQDNKTCTVPLTFRVRSAGPATDELLCATATGEGYTLTVTSALSQPAGTSACSGHVFTPGDELPFGYYFASGSRLLFIRSPIAGTDMEMELEQTGGFETSLRMMFSRSVDGGNLRFTSLADVTTSVTSGSTILRGTGVWSDVKVISALELDTAASDIPTLGEGFLILLGLAVLLSGVLILRRHATTSPSGR